MESPDRCKLSLTELKPACECLYEKHRALPLYHFFAGFFSPLWDQAW